MQIREEVILTSGFLDIWESSRTVPSLFVRGIPPHLFTILIHLLILLAYIGDDYPESVPITNDDRSVIMNVEESVYFDVRSPTSEEEWMSTMPYGKGMLRLGQDHRMFAVTMFHELHCMRYIHGVLTATKTPLHAHLHHCLDYLRQMTLCDADLTLEAGDFMTRNFTEERGGSIHICRDWEAVYDEATMNWISWYKYRKAHESEITACECKLDFETKTEGLIQACRFCQWRG